jgi:CubicO group peptidase (beta-lactamase class C family)
MAGTQARTDRWLSWCAVALLGLGSAACSSDPETDEAEARAETAPVAVVPETEWDVHPPGDEGMDPEVLDRARDYAFGQGMNTQGVVVVRHGVIVAEWYADGADDSSWAASWSVAKSFTSALIGIAIDEGAIPGVDEPMTTYFPDWAGTPREAITLRDVLQMSSGLDWDEDYDPAALGESEIIHMVLGESDQLAYASSRPSRTEPGIEWSYSSGDTMLLSRVLEQATGMPVDEYAREKLFDAIGMEQVEWWRDAAGHTLTYCCLDTTSRGFARFGLLYLREGSWGDEQVVPASWVEESLEAAPASTGRYGYQWWLDIDGAPDDTFAALGHDGQYIYVIPSLDLVVVRNGLYVKDPGEPVADPNLFAKYPSDGLAPGRGTTPPEGNWDDAEFLAPIVESIQD